MKEEKYKVRYYAPTLKRLARLAKCTTRTASTAMDSLEKLGLMIL